MSRALGAAQGSLPGGSLAERTSRIFLSRPWTVVRWLGAVGERKGLGWVAVTPANGWRVRRRTGALLKKTCTGNQL